MVGIIGRKLGMTQIFDDEGAAVPVTVIEAGPCPVVQIKDDESDGYRAVQLGFGAQKDKRATRAERGHAEKAGLERVPELIREFRVDETDGYEQGQEVTVEEFEKGESVNITGTSKGRGFQGVVKRYGFSGRPETHGHSMSRNPGAVGMGTDPSRVIKGKKMPGQMGSARTTIRNLRVERVDAERNLIFLRGGVPGARNGLIMIRKA